MVKIASVAQGTIVLTKFNTCKCPKFFIEKTGKDWLGVLENWGLTLLLQYKR